MKEPGSKPAAAGDGERRILAAVAAAAERLLHAPRDSAAVRELLES